MKLLHSITDSVDMSLSKLSEIVKDGEARCAAVHGVAKHRTQLSDSITTTLSCQAPKVIKPTYGFTENQTKEECFLFSSCFSQHNSPFNKRNIYKQMMFESFKVTITVCPFFHLPICVYICFVKQYPEEV